MSVLSTWDLESKYSPRCLAVFPEIDGAPARSASTNPFDRPRSESKPSSPKMCMLYGTDRGSLHYRSFPVPEFLSSSMVASPTKHQQKEAQERGIPADLFGGLPGPIISCIPLATGSGLFLVLVDDNRGHTINGGAYAAHLIWLQPQAQQLEIITSSNSKNLSLPRMSSAQYEPSTGIVYSSGRSIMSLPFDRWERLVPVGRSGSGGVSSSNRSSRNRGSNQSLMQQPTRLYQATTLPSPGVRSGSDALALVHDGSFAVVAVGNAFYAVAAAKATRTGGTGADYFEPLKLLTFTQSSQVHPVICFDVKDQSLDPGWSLVFLASGRECAVVDVQLSRSMPLLSCGKQPRHGVVTLPSPILAAATSWPWVSVLTSDGLISIRSPACLAMALRTVEVGTQPNDFFCLRTLAAAVTTPLMDTSSSNYNFHQPWIAAASYAGQAKLLQCQPDTTQDLADRLMRYAIDALGVHGFPRQELAQALHASFTATSYVGSEPSQRAKRLLQEYLQAILGLGLTDWDGGGSSAWLTTSNMHKNAGDGFIPPPIVSAEMPASLLTGTALLCLVCSQLSPSPNSTLANRASKACAEAMGIVVVQGTPSADDPIVSASTLLVCEAVADRLLQRQALTAKSSFSLVTGSSPAPIASVGTGSQNVEIDFLEAAVWLLRSCGKHERAIQVAYERLRQKTAPSEGGNKGYWSPIKYESYTATHLSDLWGSQQDAACELVLHSEVTHRLLEGNPELGLSVFTAQHPKNVNQWRSMPDPLVAVADNGEYGYRVVKLLKSIQPVASHYDKDSHATPSEDKMLPLESGRALAVTYIESAIGILTGRPSEASGPGHFPKSEDAMDRVANFHDELCCLLLEGVIAERRDDDIQGEDSPLGKIYRHKLRQFLRWPPTQIRADHFLEALPASFYQEKALVLGKLGRHEDALRILYVDLSSLDLALEYCDDLASRDQLRSQQQVHDMGYHPDVAYDTKQEDREDDNAYLPLIRVALESDPQKGATVAIQILALRRSAIDRAAALRLLPSDIPVSAVARPFLIPALIDGESQVRRLTVVSALLRAKYLRLKEELTNAQLKAQANLYVVPQLKSLNLGDPLHSTNAFRARTAAAASPTMPDVMIVKHFFPGHLVIQAKVTNILTSFAGQRTMGDIVFFVAESSEEAIHPLLQVPIQTLPVGMTGSAWCVLEAFPGRMDGSTAQLTCELRYSIQSTDNAGAGHNFVADLQDLEVHAAHFS